MNGKMEISYSIDHVSMNETGKVLYQQHRTRMTLIGRIFTDPCAFVSSAQSVFNRNPSGALRLMFSRKTQDSLVE